MTNDHALGIGRSKKLGPGLLPAERPEPLQPSGAALIKTGMSAQVSIPWSAVDVRRPLPGNPIGDAKQWLPQVAPKDANKIADCQRDFQRADIRD